MRALSSSVIIICAGLEIDVADAISLSFNHSLSAKIQHYSEYAIIMAKIICWRGILLQAKTSQGGCPPVRLRCMRHHADAFRIKT
jgi:hypothetical protein